MMSSRESPTAGQESLAGVIFGTAVGDALGLPREGMSRRRARRLFGGPPLHHRFLFGRGMVSDDTEHTCMVGQALLRCPHDVRAFSRSLAWRLRLWLLGLPAGTGGATLRAMLKLWLGFPPERSGVYSAGNGPAMRAALLGVYLGHDPPRLRAYVRASTRLTHTDPRAERGAVLVALAAHHGAVHGPAGVRRETFMAEARAALTDCDARLERLLEQIERYLERNAPAGELAETLGLKWGVTGYIYHSVPLALYCWLRHPGDFRQAVEEVIEMGGDADSTGAIVGGISGATLGASAIPSEWVNGLLEWPRTQRWMRRLAERLAEQAGGEQESRGRGPLPLFWPGLIVRNLFFLGVVLAHIVRRLLPPY